MEYKVGDKVKIREDLTEDKRYGDNTTVGNMMKYVGRIATIAGGIGNRFGFKLDIGSGLWNWTPEMFDQNWKEDKFMKTSEFKVELEKLGYTFEDSCVTNKDNLTVAWISALYMYRIDSKYAYDISPKLFNLIYKYASTPIDEREDESKLFNVQIVKGNWSRSSWLYRDEDYDVRTSFSTSNNCSNQQWTLEQIKKYGIDDETVYKRVPVGD